MTEVESLLTAAAGRAFRSTRFYADLYGEEPREAAELPYLSSADYYRASGLLDCVVEREAIVGVLPPYARDAGLFPFTVPEDEPELVLRQRRIVRAMKDLGVDFAVSPRFLIVTDGRRGPFACELAKGFYWEGLQTSIVFQVGSADELRADIDAHAADYVVLVAGRHLRESLERPRHTVWLVEHSGDRLVDDHDYPSLLYADGVDLIGSRALGRAEYDYDREQLLIETDPRSRLSHVSKLQFTCFPLIRFGVGWRVPVVETLAKNEV